ncbi:hypothetical protein OSH39_12205, partial [Mycobacterium ulcerans]|nr:hypothetical protein [Mycobacterium ulcerans]MEB3924071.1 hypothetical protein [Mycobacterium ulcerans]MEB3932393.1 hypothetical protein [Mycobacterium ulcerans]MEB3957029.1 hypothetical protein [Mycobacterium ulcerans]MEB3990724.1 hypothetical protein [Mycobacterium ulcerans]
FDRQPPPRPPQSTIPQLTSLLINNAGALGLGVGVGVFDLAHAGPHVAVDEGPHGSHQHRLVLIKLTVCPLVVHRYCPPY